MMGLLSECHSPAPRLHSMRLYVEEYETADDPDDLFPAELFSGVHPHLATIDLFGCDIPWTSTIFRGPHLIKLSVANAAKGELKELTDAMLASPNITTLTLNDSGAEPFHRRTLNPIQGGTIVMPNLNSVTLIDMALYSIGDFLGVLGGPVLSNIAIIHNPLDYKQAVDLSGTMFSFKYFENLKSLTLSEFASVPQFYRPLLNKGLLSLEYLHLQGCWIGSPFIKSLIPQKSEDPELNYWPVPCLRTLSLDGVDAAGDVIKDVVEARHAATANGMARLRKVVLREMCPIKKEHESWLRENLDTLIIEKPAVNLRWSHPPRREYRGRIR